MTTISKTVYEFTVLHRSDKPPLDIDQAVAESFDGGMCGWETSCETVLVPDEQVPAELVALGNDGHFFDDALGES